MEILSIILGLAFIAVGFFLRPGSTIGGKTLCQGEISSLDQENATITLKYTYKKEEYFHTFRATELPLFTCKMVIGEKIPLLTEKGNPENIITVIPNGKNMRAISRMTIGIGAFLALGGIMMFLD